MKRAAAAPESYTPRVAELDEARKRVLEYEPRDLFYRVASELIELALTGKTSITVIPSRNCPLEALAFSSLCV